MTSHAEKEVRLFNSEVIGPQSQSKNKRTVAFHGRWGPQSPTFDPDDDGFASGDESNAEKAINKKNQQAPAGASKRFCCSVPERALVLPNSMTKSTWELSMVLLLCTVCSMLPLRTAFLWYDLYGPWFYTDVMINAILCADIIFHLLCGYEVRPPLSMRSFCPLIFFFDFFSSYSSLSLSCMKMSRPLTVGLSWI
jgi:hypothetical protein